MPVLEAIWAAFPLRAFQNQIVKHQYCDTLIERHARRACFRRSSVVTLVTKKVAHKLLFRRFALTLLRKVKLASPQSARNTNDPPKKTLTIGTVMRHDGYPNTTIRTRNSDTKDGGYDIFRLSRDDITNRRALRGR